MITMTDPTLILNKHKNTIFNIIIFAVFFFFSFKLYTKDNATYDELVKRKNDEVKINEIMQLVGSYEKKASALEKKVNVQDVQGAIRYLMALAKESEISVLALKPAGERDSQIYSFNVFDIKLRASSFHKLGKFIAKVENSDSIFMISQCKIHVSSDTQRVSDRNAIELLVDAQIDMMRIKK